MLALADQLDACAAHLSLKERFIYAQAPTDTRSEHQPQYVLDWAAQHAYSGKAGKPWLLAQVDGCAGSSTMGPSGS